MEGLHGGLERRRGAQPGSIRGRGEAVQERRGRSQSRMSQVLGQEDGVMSSKTGCQGDKPVGWAREGGMVAHVQGQFSCGRDADLSTQAVTKAQRFDGRAHANAEPEDRPLGTRHLSARQGAGDLEKNQRKSGQMRQ